MGEGERERECERGGERERDEGRRRVYAGKGAEDKEGPQRR